MGSMGLHAIAFALALTVALKAAPAPGEAEFSASANANIPPLISFDKGGNVGVNFLGFKASAGLGGLLSGDASAGGLHAEAETPFGQKAGAGLGGKVDGSGRSVGGLYAGATAGGNVGAAAGLGGVAGAEGSVGGSYAGASAGGITKEVVKETYTPAVASSGGFSASFGGSITKNVAVAPVKEVEVVHEEVKPQKTYVERTVIPNYVEKTIQVPSYVEKTIRVPTVVEKKVRVPAPPTVIEKTVSAPEHVDFGTAVEVEKEVAPVYVRKRIHPHPHRLFHFRKYVNLGSDVGAGNQYDYGGYGGYGGYGAAAADYGSGAGVGNQGTYTASFRKTVNPQLLTDIFNIPISTLGAVSKLVGGIAGGTSVSGSFEKSYSAY